MQLGLRDGGQVFHGVIGAHDHVDARFTRFAARQPRGPGAPMIGDDGGVHGLQELDGAHEAIATRLRAGAATVASEREFPHQHREAFFENFRVRDPGVGHVGVHPAGAREARARARAAADGLVVAEALVAEGQVVHGALARGQHPERLEQRVRDALRRLDIAGCHGRRILRREHAAGRYPDVQRA